MADDLHFSESDSDDDYLEQDQRDAILARFLRNVFYETEDITRNEDLIRTLKRSKTLTDPKVEEALIVIPREYFVTPDLKNVAYNDCPLRFPKMAFNISAPHMYALCLEKLNIQPGNVILDIGSGSGHLTALAGYLTGPGGLVHGLDLFDYIIEFSNQNIKNFLASRPKDAPPIDLSHVHFFKRNCFLPDPEETKYDRIHVGCCCPESRINYLYDLLKPDGILVTPFGDKLIKATKKNGQVTVETLLAVRYSDLTLPSDAEIKDAKKLLDIAKANKIIVPQTVIREQFRNLVDNPIFPDFVFIVEGKKVMAHRLLLKLRSKFFVDYFSRPDAADFLEISDTNCKFHIFTEFLRFIYSDNCMITDENVDQLRFLANRFEILPLLAKVDGKEMPGCTLIDQFEKLVGSEEFSDVSFTVEGTKSIPSHKLILAVRTEYFHRMFNSGLRESQTNNITIFDSTAENFKIVLHFIYTDHCTVTSENCVDLLELANFFQLDRLKAFCEKYWFDNINVSNAAHILSIADRFNAVQLKDFAMEFIFSHIQEVVVTDSFKELDQSVVTSILIRSVQRSK
eukprot:TRINITY_DN3166_c0_g1_i1.p1 TRINITY_DN3166_c0_g1~~TRINITY_DN3166_c0_g1_i1.p1  ORF type:complete len:580 (+),score=70.41 TRINITY_DN3166_c0_g1_i1:34-1740(+)